MGRDAMKLLLFAGMIAFAVLYGMELASGGIAGVYGPMDESDRELYRQTASVLRPDAETRFTGERGQGSRWPDDGPADGRGSAGLAAEAWDSPPWDGRRPVVDRLAGEAARVLSRLSQGGIRLIVTAFSRTTELPDPPETENAEGGPAAVRTDGE